MPNLLVFLLLLACITIKGQHNDSTLLNNQTKVLSIGSLNDSYNGAFVPNRDDYRSFGFDLKFNYGEKWKIYSAYTGYTNRSRKDTINAGRLDELMFYGQYKLASYNGFSIYPALGFALSGNLGGADFQNGIHEDVGEPLVYLPYDYESAKTSIILGVHSNKNISLAQISPLLSLKNELSFYHAVNYGNIFSVGGKLIKGKEQVNNISFSVSYQYKNIWTSPTMEAISEQESGLRLSFEQDISFFTLGYEIYPLTGFGYGRLGINLLKTGDNKEYERADIVVDFKALVDRGGYYSNYKLNFFHIGNHSVNASLGHMYGTYTSNVIESHPGARGQYIQINLGLESYLFEIKPKFQVNPYFGTGIGFKVESTFSGEDSHIETQNSTSALTYADIGIRIGSPVRFISKSTLLGFVIGDIFSVPFTSKQQEVNSQTISFLEQTNNFYLGFNFALDF